MDERETVGRGSARRWLIVGVVLVVLAAIGWLVLDRTVLQDRRLKKDAAISHCISDLRADVARRLHGAGLADADSAATAANAQFGQLDVMRTTVSEDAQGLLRHEGRPESSVLAVWQVNGTVSLPGSVPFGGGLESRNRFVCAALVFDDGSVDTSARQIYP